MSSPVSPVPPPLPEYVPADMLESPVAPAPRPSFWDVPKAVGLVILFQVLAGVVGGFIYAVTRVGGPRTAEGLTNKLLPFTSAVFSLSLLWTAYHFRCRKYGLRFKEGLAFTKPSKRAVIWAVAMPLVCFAAIIAIAVAMYASGGGESAALEQSMIGQLTSNPQGMLFFAALAVLAAPFEEIFFRGFLFPLFQTRLGSFLAIVLTSVLFMLIHAFQLGGHIPSLVIILVMGTVFTLQRYYTKSIIPSLITHEIYNGMFAACLVVAAYSAASHTPAAPAVVHGSKPTTEEMKHDLLGRKIGAGINRWSFDNVDEFQKFEIQGEDESQGKYTANVQVELDGTIGPDARANLDVTYERIMGGYKLQKVTDNGTLKQIEARGTAN